MMNRKHSRTLAALTAVMAAAIGAAGVDTAADAEPGEVSSGGLHVIASVDENHVVSTGGNLALGVPFAHAAKVSGNFSAVFDGTSSLRSGQIVAGYLVGCAVDISDGIEISIAAVGGGEVAVTPGAALTIDTEGAAALTVGSEVTFAGNGELGGEFSFNLAPGSVTAVAIAEAELDQESTFPYTFAHSNTALNINGCLSPASAMPFITVRANARNGVAQTTGYGDQFVF
ncbi:MspA family porin [Nocardia sp. NPDC023852]|uniref:MspA family porin n=1 Tax=Nocardia sp. NPDC023852 TaxID=3154697 RepID=UPI0034064F97